MKKSVNAAETAEGAEKKTTRTRTSSRAAKAAKDTVKTEEAVKAAAKKAGETVAAVKEAAKKAESTVKESAKKAETTVKESAKKAGAVKEELEEGAKKVVAKAAKKIAVQETVYLQYAGREINTGNLIAQVKAFWTKELNNKETAISSITLYLKPEENKAYYVINGEVTGSLDL